MEHRDLRFSEDELQEMGAALVPPSSMATTSEPLDEEPAAQRLPPVLVPVPIAEVGAYAAGAVATLDPLPAPPPVADGFTLTPAGEPTPPTAPTAPASAADPLPEAPAAPPAVDVDETPRRADVPEAAPEPRAEQKRPLSTATTTATLPVPPEPEGAATVNEGVGAADDGHPAEPGAPPAAPLDAELPGGPLPATEEESPPAAADDTSPAGRPPEPLAHDEQQAAAPDDREPTADEPLPPSDEAERLPAPAVEDLLEPSLIAGPDLLSDLDLGEERLHSDPEGELVLDESDQLPLTAEEMAEVESVVPGGGVATSWPEAPAATTAPPSGTANGEGPSGQARALPPPPPAVALKPSPRRGERSRSSERATARLKTEELKSDAPVPWYARIFDEGYLDLARRRSTRSIVRQVDFLEKQLALPPSARILDLGCGLGAHVRELAGRGYDVTGLDLSEPLLEEARSRADLEGLQNAHFVQGDMRGMESEGQFDAILSLGTSFGYFDDTTNVRVLKAVAAALRPGGRFVLDLLNRDFVLGEQPIRNWYQAGQVIVLEEGRFDYARSQLVVQRQLAHGDGRQRQDEIRVRLYSLHELNNLFRVLGLEVQQVFGSSVAPLPFLGASARTILMITEKQ